MCYPTLIFMPSWPFLHMFYIVLYDILLIPTQNFCTCTCWVRQVSLKNFGCLAGKLYAFILWVYLSTSSLNLHSLNKEIKIVDRISSKILTKKDEEHVHNFLLWYHNLRLSFENSIELVCLISKFICQSPLW